MDIVKVDLYLQRIRKRRYDAKMKKLKWRNFRVFISPQLHERIKRIEDKTAETHVQLLERLIAKEDGGTVTKTKEEQHDYTSNYII